MLLEFYNKLAEKEKKVFLFAIMAVVVAIFDNLFLRPTLSNMAGMDTEILEKTSSIRNDSRYLSYEERVKQEDKVYRVFSADEAKTEEQIIAAFLKTIELLASESNISISKLSPSGLEQKKGFILYYASLECGGRLPDMIVFMHKIDVTQNLLKIVKFNMSGKKASAEDVTASLKVAKLIIDPKTIGNYDFEDQVFLKEMADKNLTTNQAEQKEVSAKTEETKPDSQSGDNQPGEQPKNDKTPSPKKGERKPEENVPSGKKKQKPSIGRPGSEKGAEFGTEEDEEEDGQGPTKSGQPKGEVPASESAGKSANMPGRPGAGPGSEDGSQGQAADDKANNSEGGGAGGSGNSSGSAGGAGAAGKGNENSDGGSESSGGENGGAGGEGNGGAGDGAGEDAGGQATGSMAKSAEPPNAGRSSSGQTPGNGESNNGDNASGTNAGDGSGGPGTGTGSVGAGGKAAQGQAGGSGSGAAGAQISNAGGGEVSGKKTGQVQPGGRNVGAGGAGSSDQQPAENGEEGISTEEFGGGATNSGGGSDSDARGYGSSSDWDTGKAGKQNKPAAKKPVKKKKTQSNAAQKEFLKLETQKRVRIDDLQTLWNEFWGKVQDKMNEGKTKKQSPPPASKVKGSAKSAAVNEKVKAIKPGVKGASEFQVDEEEDSGNLWEKLLNKKPKKNEEE